MSDSVRPHRWQPTRLPHPWDSLGKNTGVGCHFLLQCMEVKSWSEKLKWSCSVMSNPQRLHGLQPTRLPHSWDFPGRSTGVGCHCLLPYSSIFIVNFLWALSFLLGCWVNFYSTKHCVKYEQRGSRWEKNVDQVKFNILFPEGSMATYQLTSQTHSGLISI